MNAFVIGAATTKFGELWQESPISLARGAFENAIKNAGLDKKNIEALFIGNMLSGILAGQAHLGAFFAQGLGLTNTPAFCLDAVQASGGMAAHMAVNSVLAGQYKTVAVLGLEKMTDYPPEAVPGALMAGCGGLERSAGATLAALYALMARAYTQKYGVAEKELASVPVKNHFHSRLNPNAQFHNLLTIEVVMESPLVSDPLKLLECAPVSDGAAALIISSDPGKVEIVASESAGDSLDLARRDSLVEMKATQIAAQKAYQKSGLGPKDVDVAEVHDCFSIAEIIAVEDLGFFARGRGARAISSGQATLGQSRRLVINTSGGLKGAGDPAGATGVRQIVEIAEQLMGRSKARQRAGARVGLAQNVGGTGATAIIHILKKI